MSVHSPYFVYIVLCSDNTLYTGITNNLTKRVHDHNHSTNGARYTKVRRPVRLVFSEIHPTKSDALKREAAIKKLSRSKKIQLTTLA